LAPKPQKLPNLKEIELFAAKLRFHCLSMSHRAGTAHLAGALSCADLLAVLYGGGVIQIDPKKPKDSKRDRLIFSKGHAISALYAALAMTGFFSEKDLENYNEEKGHLPEQPSPGCAPGVEWATGSLGHGLGVGLGMALAGKIHQQDYRTFVLMSDGECQEGSVWEAAMFAPRHQLGNLVAMVDFNKWQATGRSTEIMQMEPMADKWRSFGWEAREVNGHSVAEIHQALTTPWAKDRPLAVVAHTVKGKGVSFIEDDNNWHYRSPTAEEIEKAKKELYL